MCFCFMNSKSFVIFYSEYLLEKNEYRCRIIIILLFISYRLSNVFATESHKLLRDAVDENNKMCMWIKFPPCEHSTHSFYCQCYHLMFYMINSIYNPVGISWAEHQFSQSLVQIQVRHRNASFHFISFGVKHWNIPTDHYNIFTS